MKSVESRIERLEASSGVGNPLPVFVVKVTSEPGDLVGLDIWGTGEFVARIPGESPEELIARATAIAEPLRGPRCATMLIEKYDND